MEHVKFYDGGWTQIMSHRLLSHIIQRQRLFEGSCTKPDVKL